MGKTKYGRKRIKRHLTSKKTDSIKPLNILKKIVGSSKKKITAGRKVIRKSFLKKSIGVRFPKVFSGGKKKNSTYIIT